MATRQMQRRATSRALSTLASPFGWASPFDICTDADIISLSMQGQSAYLAWLGFEMTDEFLFEQGFISYERPAYANGAPTPGWLSDPCAAPNGVDYGTCNLILEDFGLLRRAGPDRNATKNFLKYCKQQPLYRVDGTLIEDVDEYDMALTARVILQDLHLMVVNGNKSTAGQFDGTKRLIKVGYDCALMDSQVVDWAGNNLNGTGGGTMTYNGAATIAGGTSLITVLLFIYQRMKDRIQWSPTLRGQQRTEGDVILKMPGWLVRCVLDAFTCWSVCEGREYNPVNIHQKEAREFRLGLMGGLFGNGKIQLDGDWIHLLAYDYGLMKGGVAKITITRAGATATATTTEVPHGLSTGDTVTISGANDAAYNITAAVTVTGANTFTYTVAGTPPTPDPSTNILVTIPNEAEIQFEFGHLGNMKLKTLQLNDLTKVPQLGNGKFATMDDGRFLTWLETVETCMARRLEMQPRLKERAPWLQARIEGITCPQIGPVLSADPNTPGFPLKTFESASPALI